MAHFFDDAGEALEERGGVGQAAQQIGSQDAVELAESGQVTGIALNEARFRHVWTAVGGQSDGHVAADVALDGDGHGGVRVCFHLVARGDEGVAEVEADYLQEWEAADEKIRSVVKLGVVKCDLVERFGHLERVAADSATDVKRARSLA